MCRLSPNLSFSHYLVVEVSLSHYLVAPHAPKVTSSGLIGRGSGPSPGGNAPVETELGNLDGNACSPLSSVPEGEAVPEPVHVAARPGPWYHAAAQRPALLAERTHVKPVLSVLDDP